MYCYVSARPSRCISVINESSCAPAEEVVPEAQESLSVHLKFYRVCDELDTHHNPRLPQENPCIRKITIAFIIIRDGLIDDLADTAGRNLSVTSRPGQGLARPSLNTHRHSVRLSENSAGAGNSRSRRIDRQTRVHCRDRGRTQKN